MNIPRNLIQNHVSLTSQALHTAASEANSAFAHRVISDRSAEVDNFADRLERTPGNNDAEIQSASQARGMERVNIGRWAGAILGGAVTVATLALGGPVGAALLYGGATLLAGVAGGEVARDSEDKFQKQLSHFSEEVAHGQAPTATSGVRLNGALTSGLMTNDEWLVSVTGSIPGIPRSPS